MTVDELITELQELKQLHPTAGRLPVIRISKKGSIKELTSVKTKIKGNSQHMKGFDHVYASFV